LGTGLNRCLNLNFLFSFPCYLRSVDISPHHGRKPGILLLMLLVPFPWQLCRIPFIFFPAVRNQSMFSGFSVFSPFPSEACAFFPPETLWFFSCRVGHPSSSHFPSLITACSNYPLFNRLIVNLFPWRTEPPPVFSFLALPTSFFIRSLLLARRLLTPVMSRLLKSNSVRLFHYPFLGLLIVFLSFFLADRL